MYAGEGRGKRRKVAVWRRDGNGPWIIWGSLGIPNDVDADTLEDEVLSRLPQPVAEDAKARVLAKLQASGVGLPV
jgi:hypothetical protein